MGRVRLTAQLVDGPGHGLDGNVEPVVPKTCIVDNLFAFNWKDAPAVLSKALGDELLYPDPEPSERWWA